MKKRQLQTVLNGIKKVNTGKFEDKSVSTPIFKDFFLFVRLQQEFEEDQEAIRKLFLDEFKDEQREVLRLGEDYKNEVDPVKRLAIYKEMNSHEKFIAANDALIDKLEALGNEEVSFLPVDQEKFWEEYQKQDYDLAVVEAISPLFTYDAPASEKKPAKK